ncbi:sorting nexin-16 [Agrilus planipennis]|uniref:Sorting nexin-16 n=1 Tax=Agrilus planipennis TaxID=224129 RepID=A0A1W4XHG7_AGRPL|nr:sorting nexin-16 [Agrilus planipennis]
MSEDRVNEITSSISSLEIRPTTFHPLSKSVDDCETAEEVATTDSDECLTETLRFRDFQCSGDSTSSDVTLTPHSSMTITEENGNYVCNDVPGEIQIPIIGYEIMEERARFTVFKLRIEYKHTGECWYVFRRYTDFVRLCNKLKKSFPHVVQYLPRKRWLGSNFNPLFLEERINGLQTLVNAILREPELLKLQPVEDFFCLNEPPICSESNQEAKAMFAAYEDTIFQLKDQLRQKESVIDSLHEALHRNSLENDNLKKILRETAMKCESCHNEIQNIAKNISINCKTGDNGKKMSFASTSSSSK